jgi:predicted ABC-type sugar transport system permease subunit
MKIANMQQKKNRFFEIGFLLVIKAVILIICTMNVQKRTLGWIEYRIFIEFQIAGVLKNLWCH